MVVQKPLKEFGDLQTTLKEGLKKNTFCMLSAALFFHTSKNASPIFLFGKP